MFEPTSMHPPRRLDLLGAHPGLALLTATLALSCGGGGSPSQGASAGTAGSGAASGTAGATAGSGGATAGSGSASAGATGSGGSITAGGSAGSSAGSAGSAGSTGGIFEPDAFDVDWLLEIWAGSRNDIPWGAVISDGAVYVAGVRADDIDLFGVGVDNAKQEVRLTKRDLATGAVLATQSAGCGSSFFNVADVTNARDIAVDAAGNVYVAGHSRCQEVEIGYMGQTWSTQTDISADGLLIAFKPTFEPLWIETQQSDGEDKTESLAVFDSSIYIAGHYSGSKLELEGVTYLQNQGAFDVYVAQYTTAGAPTGAVVGIGGSEDDGQPSIAVDEVGNVYVTGYMRSSPTRVYDLGGTLAQLDPVGANAEVFVVKLSPDLDYIWGAVLGGTGDDKGKSLAAAGGDIYVGGFFEDDMTLPGCCDLVGAGGKDGFFAVLQADGTPHAAVAMGGAGTDRVHATRVLPATGRVFVAGSFSGTMEIGDQSFTAAGKDAFWASFDRDGQLAFAGKADGDQEDEAMALATFDDVVTVAGHFSSAPISVGALTAGKSGDKADAFLLRMTKVP